jgi:hypothetical protein
MQSVREHLVIDANGLHQYMQLIQWLIGLVLKPFQQALNFRPLLVAHTTLDFTGG